MPDYIEDEALVRSTTGEVFEYVPGLTDASRGDTIILHLKSRGLPTKRLVGHLDGSAQSIPEAEFDRKMAAQGKP